MKITLTLSLLAVGTAFSPQTVTPRTKTQLDVSRRDAILSGILGAASAFAAKENAAAYQSAYGSQAGIGSDRIFANDHEYIAAQQPTGDKLDLNSAFVVRTSKELTLVNHHDGKILIPFSI